MALGQETLTHSRRPRLQNSSSGHAKPLIATRVARFLPVLDKSEGESTMAKLGSDKRPAVVRVRTMPKCEEIVALCERYHWKVIVGIEPDQPEDLSDIDLLLRGPAAESPTPRAAPRIGRNDYCPCGSGKKFKNCCATL